MAAAVSNAGGLGTLGLNAGQTTVTADPRETAERLRAQIRKTRQLTDKPFGVNYILPSEGERNPFTEACLSVILEENVSVLIVVGVANAVEISRLKSLGLTVIFRELIPTISGSKLAEHAGADLLVATRSDEGGGAPNNRLGTFSVVPMIADAVRIPVLAAGGIADSRAVRAAFALGAQGVFVGTRFVASKECPASPVSKAQIVESASDSTIALESGSLFYRSTPTAFMQNAIKDKQDAVPIHRFKIGILDGDLAQGINCVSSSISQIREVTSCEEIVRELARGIF